MFTVSVDCRRLIIEAKLRGFMDLHDVANFGVAMDDAITANEFDRSGYFMLLDVSEFALQSMEVVAALDESRAARVQPWRIAIVTGDSIARMQAKRVSPAQSQVFEERAPAIAWLLQFEGRAAA